MVRITYKKRQLTQLILTWVVFLYALRHRGHSGSLLFSMALSFQALSHYTQNGTCLHELIITHLGSDSQLTQKSRVLRVSASSLLKSKFIWDLWIFDPCAELGSDSVYSAFCIVKSLALLPGAETGTCSFFFSSRIFLSS